MHLRCTRCESSSSRRHRSPMMSSAARFGSRQRGLCSANAMMLPGFRIVRRPIERGQSRPRELPLGVRHVWPGTDSRVAQSRSAGQELLLLSWAAASQQRARSPAIQIHAIDTRGHACDIVQSIHTDVLIWSGSGQRRRPDGLDTTSCYYVLQR